MFGDVLSLVAALIYGFHVVRLGVLAPRFPALELADTKEQSRLLFSLLSFTAAAFSPLIFQQTSPVFETTMKFLQSTPIAGWTVFLAVVITMIITNK